MIVRVLVTDVSVDAVNVSTPFRDHDFVPGAWSAQGVVIGTGASASWRQRPLTGGPMRRLTVEPMPVPGTFVDLDLEPASWKDRPT